jgi:hypothetical protein
LEWVSVIVANCDLLSRSNFLEPILPVEEVGSKRYSLALFYFEHLLNFLPPKYLSEIYFPYIPELAKRAFKLIVPLALSI